MPESLSGGKIILISGPSGSGKGALIQYVRTVCPDLLLSISCTTRVMRPGEVDGREYHFLTIEEFKKRIDQGAFLEWAQYGGNYYGTPAAPVLEALAAGSSVLLEIEIQGVQQIQEKVAPGDIVTIFIDAGPWEDLVARIQARAPISETELEKRHARFDAEMAYKDTAMFVIQNTNGRFEDAKKALADRILSITAR